MKRAQFEKQFPIKNRTLCGISVVGVDFKNGARLLAYEAGALSPKKQVSANAFMNIFFNEDHEDYFGVVADKVEPIRPGFASLGDYCRSKRSNAFNPGRVFPDSATAECWFLEEKDGRDLTGLWGRLKEQRLIVELLRMHFDGMKCPILRKCLHPTNDGEARLRIEMDHCLPGLKSKGASPIRLMSHDANAMFGHMPWSIKGPILAEPDGPMASRMRTYSELLMQSRAKEKEDSGALP